MTWQKKLGFLLFWTFSHGVSGALGLVLAESIVRAKAPGSYAGIAGVILFEGTILFSKEIGFRRFREMILVHAADLLSWIAAGIIVTLGRLLGDSPYNEEFTPISLDLIRWSILFGISIAPIAHLPRLVNWLKPKFSNWHNQLKEFFVQRSLLEPLKYPVYVLIGLFLYILILVPLAIYFLALFFLSIAPIEFFKEEFQDLLWPMKTVWFGLSTVGFAGFITGLCYLLLPRSESFSSLFSREQDAKAIQGR